MKIIKTMIRTIEDIREGHKLVQDKRKAFRDDLMEQGICLTQDEDRVVKLLQRGADRCNALVRDLTKEFSN